MRILALDPARYTGFAFSSIKDRVEHSGVWNLEARGETSGDQLQRLDDYVTDAIEKWRPEVIAFELAGHGSHNMHAKAMHNEKVGVVQLVAFRHRLPAWGFLPNTWKARAIGKGNAKKHEVQRSLVTFFGIETGSEDQADAICILLAAQQGPPPTPVKAQRKAERKKLKSLPRLFR